MIAAASRGHTSVVEVLLNAGANLDHRKEVFDYCINMHLNTLYLYDRLSAYLITIQSMLSTIPVALIRTVKRL